MPDDQQQQGGDDQQQGGAGDDQQQGDQQQQQGGGDRELERALEEIRSDPETTHRTIEALKSEAADYRKRLRTVQTELDELKRTGLSDQERAVAEAEARGRQAAEEAYARRTLEAEIRATAAGKLQDPADAIRYLDVAALLEHDERDRDRELGKAIEKLVEDKPYLAVSDNGQQSSRGVPRGSQGARTTPGGATSADADGNAWLRKAAGRSRR